MCVEVHLTIYVHMHISIESIICFSCYHHKKEETRKIKCSHRLVNDIRLIDVSINNAYITCSESILIIEGNMN
jgi:hypothetical protein